MKISTIKYAISAAYPNLFLRVVCLVCLFQAFTALSCLASDWEEEQPPVKKESNSRSYSDTGRKPDALQGHVEKSGESLRIEREKNGELKNLALPGTDRSEAKSVDDELKGMVKDGSLRSLYPQNGFNPSEPLKGFAGLAGGKAAIGQDPDADDGELLVEWDRWRNRFLRAVQLGTQEILNNPDPEDYVRPRVDMSSGRIMSPFGLGTSAAFSCQISSDGQVKNLEIISPSGNPKFDRAVLKAVQQLAFTQILKFPRGSHRSTVSQPGRITTARSNEFKPYRFNDVERVTAP